MKAIVKRIKEKKRKKLKRPVEIGCFSDLEHKKGAAFILISKCSTFFIYYNLMFFNREARLVVASSSAW